MTNPRKLAPMAVAAATVAAEIVAPEVCAVTAHLTTCSPDHVSRSR